MAASKRFGSVTVCGVSAARFIAGFPSNDMKLHAGDSDLAGTLTLDEGTKPQKLTAKLTSQNLVFADLAPAPHHRGREGRRRSARPVRA